MKSIFYSKNIQVESAVMFFTDLLINEAFYYYTLTQLDGCCGLTKNFFFSSSAKNSFEAFYAHNHRKSEIYIQFIALNLLARSTRAPHLSLKKYIER